eukprot:gene57878-biopygen120251
MYHKCIFPSISTDLTEARDPTPPAERVTTAYQGDHYGNDENCDITPLVSGELVVDAFETEPKHDKLTIAGIDYSGSFSTLGMIVDTTTSITWSSNSGGANKPPHSDSGSKGFRICLTAWGVPTPPMSPSAAATCACAAAGCAADGPVHSGGDAAHGLPCGALQGVRSLRDAARRTITAETAFIAIISPPCFD